MILAVVFTVVLGLLSVFQLALAFGAPWGRFAWGGQHEGVLPVGYRIGSAASPLVYGLIAVLAFDRVGVIDVVPDAVSQVGMWVVFVVLALGVVMNAISRSKHERYTATPVALVLAVLALFIALLGEPSEPIGESRPGFPAGMSQEEQEELLVAAGQPAAWIDGDRLTLLTWGSSSCPAEVRGLAVPDPTTIEVVLGGPGGACTDDLSPRTHVLTLPEPVTERPVTVVVDPGTEQVREAVVE